MIVWAHSPGYWLGMVVITAALCGLIIAGIIALVRHAGGARRPEENGGPAGPEEGPAERFARGEIDAGEYERRRNLVRDAPAHATGRPWMAPYGRPRAPRVSPAVGSVRALVSRRADT